MAPSARNLGVGTTAPMLPTSESLGYTFVQPEALTPYQQAYNAFVAGAAAPTRFSPLGQVVNWAMRQVGRGEIFRASDPFTAGMQGALGAAGAAVRRFSPFAILGAQAGSQANLGLPLNIRYQYPWLRRPQEFASIEAYRQYVINVTQPLSGPPRR